MIKTPYQRKRDRERFLEILRKIFSPFYWEHPNVGNLIVVVLAMMSLALVLIYGGIWFLYAMTTFLPWPPN